MTENTPKTSTVEKKCHDNECNEKIGALHTDQIALFKRFTYCPYCAEELILVCHACQEQLDNTDYKFCPWCGAKFVDDQEDPPKK